MTRPTRVAPITALVFLIASVASAQTFDAAALRSFAGLSEDQWKALDNGKVQAKILDPRQEREVAVVGVARLRASTACFLSKFQDIVGFGKSPYVLGTGKFTPPFKAADLAGLRLGPRDIANLRSCSVGNCDVKLPADAIESIRHRVDWSRPNSAARAQAVFRAWLLSYLNRYLLEGNAALVVYQDRKNPVRLAQEFGEVLDERPGLAQIAPQLSDFLNGYPHDRPPGISDFFYWSMETFGFRPVASVTHVGLDVQPGRAVIVSQQLYASHYFDTSLGVTAALDTGNDPSHPEMYLVYLNRSRIDLLGGFFGGLKRVIVRTKVRQGMQNYMTQVVQRLEASCAGEPNAHRGAR